MNIQWYPGHMKKTHDLIEEHIKLVDLVVELLDARAVRSTINPQFDDLLGNKKRLKVLNKSDLADPEINKEWIDYFQSTGYDTLLFNAKSDNPSKLIQQIEATGRFVHEKNLEQNRRPRAIRAMIIGVPNVGKSSLINRIAGKYVAKAHNKPGVTRGKQWIRLGRVDLFDTPGILWPKFEDERQARHLAFIGSINDDILDLHELSYYLIEELQEKYPNALKERFSIEGIDPFSEIAKKRGCILSGGRIDEERTSTLIMDEFRSGKLGRFSLESPTE
ncbi:ribosome biogenesis GTPase YlqF [Guggenheimella bovis]